MCEQRMVYIGGTGWSIGFQAHFEEDGFSLNEIELFFISQRTRVGALREHFESYAHADISPSNDRKKSGILVLCLFSRVQVRQTAHA